MNEQQKKNFRIYEAVSHEAAMDASEAGVGLTDEERTEAYRFAEEFRASIRAKRRAERAAQMKERVRPSILVMARDAVEQWLRELFAAYPTAVIAHRDLTELSNDDLRTALEDALTLIERMS
ncbi:MAG: hypothetical protein NT062_06040 [Proteobacteria bacterium]|nr:hypothetical protein [Pseudomonadota bacterium]